MNKKTEKKRISSCDICMNYTYDEDYECYTCEMNLDEDEMYRFVTGTNHDCPYFRMGDEYRVGFSYSYIFALLCERGSADFVVCVCAGG